ncbi:MAG: hypothetical protein ACM358_14950 [Gemmatimonadota bacterium]
MRVRLLVPILFIASPLAAQMPWTHNLPSRGLALDILRPSFRSGTTSATGVAAYISGRFPTGGVAIRFELPLAYGSMDSTSFSLGNPYVGIETGRETGVVFELGARGPLASENELALQVGALSDVTRLLEAFTPDVATIAGQVRWRFRDASGFTFDAGGGPSVLFPTQGGGDPELILHHHMMAGYHGTDVWAMAGFGGWTIITEDAGGVGERTIDQVGGSFGLASGNVRPAFHVLVPLDNDFNSFVGVVLGLGVSVTFK